MELHLKSIDTLQLFTMEKYFFKTTKLLELQHITCNKRPMGQITRLQSCYFTGSFLMTYFL